MARVTPQGPNAPAAVQIEEPFTPVLSKTAKRRLRLEERARLDQEKNTPVELPRPAPERVAHKTAHMVEKLTQVSPRGLPISDVETALRKDQDKDQDHNQNRNNDWRTPARASKDLDQEELDHLPVWMLKCVGASFSSRYQAIRWMEKEQQLTFRVNVSPTGDFLIRAGSSESACALEEFAGRQPNGIVLEKKETQIRCVVLGFPAHFPLDPIADHPVVIKAERCLYSAGRGRRLPTRSVRVTLRGKLQPSLDLGCWGSYACRRFVPEPLQCYRCQAFGHHQRNCRSETELCGVCGGEHATRVCRQRRHDGEDPTPLCVNCGARHYAWHSSCPARLRRIPGAAPPGRNSGGTQSRPPAAATSLHPEAACPPGTGPRSKGLLRRRRRRGKRSTMADEYPQHPPLSAPAGVHMHPTAHSTWSEARGTDVSTQEEVTGVRVHLHPTPRSTCSAEKGNTDCSQGSSTLADPGHTARMTRIAVGEGAIVKESRTTVTTLGLRNKRTQTRGCWSFSEDEIEDLLIRYEHLLAQEREAQNKQISHEPALHCTKRHLRESRPVPTTLPVGRPLQNPPRCRYHRGEKDWVHYKVNGNRDPEKTKGDEEVEEDQTSAVAQEQHKSIASVTTEEDEVSPSPPDNEFAKLIKIEMARLEKKGDETVLPSSQE